MSKFVASGDRIVGSRLRLRRKQCAMSERGLAAILGVSEQEIHAYERGEVRIGPERLAKVSEALQAPIAFFFAGASPDDVRAADSKPGEVTLSPGAGQLVSAYSRIASSQLRSAVLRLALRLAHEERAAAMLPLAEGYARKHRWH